MSAATGCGGRSRGHPSREAGWPEPCPPPGRVLSVNSVDAVRVVRLLSREGHSFLTAHALSLGPGSANTAENSVRGRGPAGFRELSYGGAGCTPRGHGFRAPRRRITRFRLQRPRRHDAGSAPGPFAVGAGACREGTALRPERGAMAAPGDRAPRWVGAAKHSPVWTSSRSSSASASSRLAPRPQLWEDAKTSVTEPSTAWEWGARAPIKDQQLSNRARSRFC